MGPIDLVGNEAPGIGKQSEKLHHASILMTNRADRRYALSMGSLKLEDRTAEYQWATDVRFDGIRLEALSDDGNTLFDVSIRDDGQITINTFGKEISADLIEAAVQIARQPR